MKRQFMALLALLVVATPALAAGGEGGANPFAGTLYQALAAAIVFFVVLFVLKKKAWGPIITGLQNREDKIKADMDAAEKASTEAAQTLKAYQEQLSQAQTEARKIVDQARADATKVGAQVKAEAESEIKGMKDRALRDMKAAKEQFMTELYAEAATLATTVAGQILKREIKAEDQDKLVQESLAELSKLNRN